MVRTSSEKQAYFMFVPTSLDRSASKATRPPAFRFCSVRRVCLVANPRVWNASLAFAMADCLALIQRYLGAPPHRVLDVGCGFGGYGRALLAAGYDWFGVEVKESDCVELARLGLPHQKVDGRSLPFAATSFDAAICVEVLEHIAAPEEFLAEIRRVTRRRLLVSVPNLELIPYLHRYAVVPWHLLEGDHKNFFTRPSLRKLLGEFFRNVEVLSYAPIPLRTPEGLPLHNHLFAICDV